MQRLHDKVRGNWQKFTTMVYELNKSRDLKERTGNHIWIKVFESTIMTEKRISWYMHIIFLTKILGIFAVSLNPIIIQNWIKKNASKVPNNLLKSNCEFKGLGKFKMILLSICLKYFQIISQVPKDWKIKIKQFLIGWYSIWSLLRIGIYTFYHRNNFGTKNINCFSCVHEDVS